MYQCVDTNGNIWPYSVDWDTLTVTVNNTQYDLDSFLSQFIVPLTNHPAVQTAHGPSANAAMQSTNPAGYLVMSISDGSVVYVPYWSKV